MALRDSYLYHVIRFLRSGQARTAEEILLLLEDERRGSSKGYAFGLKGPKTVEAMQEVLNGLADIGILPKGGDDRGFLGADTHRANAAGGGGDSDGGRNDQDGKGGRGLSEVLGHPVLFCLPNESQDALLDAAFGIGPTEGHIHQ